MKTRIISAAVAIVLLAAVLYLHTTVVFNIAFAIIGSVMVYELFGAYKLKGHYVYLCSSIAVTSAFAVMPRFLIPDVGYFAVALAYIVLSLLILLKEHEKLEIGVIMTVAAVTLLVSAAMCSISLIEGSDEAFGLEKVILTLCGAWLADSGAYFVGTFMGKHKLCPKISPKKTVEGFIGGVLTNGILFMLFGLIVSMYDTSAKPNYLILGVLGLVCSVLSVIGDLFASLIKRSCDIKDFGKIMPGHGGAFDRFDSVVYVATFMAICLSMLDIL